MRDVIRLPIFIHEKDTVGVSLFDRREAAEYKLEPWYVEEYLDRGYDAEGRLLKIEVNPEPDRLPGVLISAAEVMPTHGGELEAHLRDTLRLYRDPVADDLSCNLAGLVEAYVRVENRPRPKVLDSVLTWLKRILPRP